ncbi:cytochrome O ubiquinol oxidase subunit II [Candidatus Carsonella ruddii]|uniref:Cytochrome O ubiquinol oxidase subunit II n=1 Tax=Candidatus Carsonella ruddii CE isolate Thao2000 TaxID=1202536 RepID=J7GYI7_CARRU|nr:cytochrome O ubiquinol oxidase subunit II [Candidatus Carsonella ruddii]AFP83653.1 cytochrome O ubiquinol oxidase subunit II [Candidatus Carsonella ruddii CE isolate Thao2000]
MIKNFIVKHFIGINRFIENKILLNTIYLIFIIIIFLLILIINSIFKNNYFYPSLIDSFIIEFLIWLLPTILIVILSIYAIKSTIELNPLKSIYNNIKPLIIEIISLNWKWIIIFPKQKILLINEFCIPINIPIKIYLISNSIINSLCIPKIGCQLYCMTNYSKPIFFLLLKHGFMHGINSNFNGIGCSYMKMNIFSVINKNFFNWIEKIKKTKIFFNYKSYNNILKNGFLIYPKLFNIRNNKLFFFIQKIK